MVAPNWYNTFNAKASLSFSIFLCSLKIDTLQVYFCVFNNEQIFNINLILTGDGLHLVANRLEVKLIKFLLICSIMFSPMVMIPYVLLRWIYPCNSATLFYFLIPACNDSSSGWTILSIITLLGICLVTLYLAYDCGGTCFIFVVDFSLVQVCCLGRYVDWTVGKIMVNPKKALSYFKYYRQIQILSRYYNLIQQEILVTTNLGLVMSGLILSVFALLSIGLQNISITELVFFATIESRIDRSSDGR